MVDVPETRSISGEVGCRPMEVQRVMQEPVPNCVILGVEGSEQPTTPWPPMGRFEWPPTIVQVSQSPNLTNVQVLLARRLSPAAAIVLGERNARRAPTSGRGRQRMQNEAIAALHFGSFPRNPSRQCVLIRPLAALTVSGLDPGSLTWCFATG